MSPLPLLLILSTLGIDAGWEPLPDGGFQYSVQLEPQQMQILKTGSVLASEVPPKYRDIRRIQITMGAAKLARTDLPAAADPGKNALVAKPVVPNPPGANSRAANSIVKTPPADLPTSDPPATPPANSSAGAAVSTGGPAGTSSANQPAAEPPAASMLATTTGEKFVANYPNAEGAQTAPEKTDGDLFHWPSLTLTLCLFASLGANLFLLWVAWGAYGRYRALARRVSASRLAI
jgi:hypothetical protein